MNELADKVYDEYGFEVCGEKTQTAPCSDQEKKKEERPTRYDEDGLGLLDFD